MGFVITQKDLYKKIFIRFCVSKVIIFNECIKF